MGASLRTARRCTSSRRSARTRATASSRRPCTPDGWSAPARVDLGEILRISDPSISRDGRRIVFSSYRLVPGAAGKPSAHLWYADWVNGKWGAPVSHGAGERGRPLSLVGRVRVRRGGLLPADHPGLDQDGDAADALDRRRIRLARALCRRRAVEGMESRRRRRRGLARPGRQRGVPGRRHAQPSHGPGRLRHLGVAPPRGEWTVPRPLGAGVNSDGYDLFPFSLPTARTLFFS